MHVHYMWLVVSTAPAWDMHAHNSHSVYVGDTKEDDQSLFVTERHCFQDLLSGLASACPCGLAVNAWAFVSALQVST